jgi:hypothetical protein
VERRKLERFDLQAPAKLRVEREGTRSDFVSLVTRDISSSGVYVATDQPLEIGARVKLELLISLDMISRMIGEGGKAKVKVDGQVVRADGKGVAIQFVNKFKMQPLGGPSSLWGILALIA